MCDHCILIIIMSLFSCYRFGASAFYCHLHFIYRYIKNSDRIFNHRLFLLLVFSLPLHVLCVTYPQQKLNYKVILNDMTLYIVFATHIHIHIHIRAHSNLLSCISNFGSRNFGQKFSYIVHLYYSTMVTHAGTYIKTQSHISSGIF